MFSPHMPSQFMAAWLSSPSHAHALKHAHMDCSAATCLGFGRCRSLRRTLLFLCTFFFSFTLWFCVFHLFYLLIGKSWVKRLMSSRSAAPCLEEEQSLGCLFCRTLFLTLSGHCFLCRKRRKACFFFFSLHQCIRGKRILFHFLLFVKITKHKTTEWAAA